MTLVIGCGKFRRMSIKSALRSAPLIGRVIQKVRPPQFIDSSSEYWEARYAEGGNSGAGSYGQLAEYKAEVLNRFVDEHDIISVIEFGCGDGAQLMLASYPHYTGIDVSRTVIETCRRRFTGRPHYAFLHTSELEAGLSAELSLSLDVIYHLVEDEVFDLYMCKLFDASTKWVIIYASNKEQADAAHVRHRLFTSWVAHNRPDFTLVQVLRNRYPYDPGDPINTSFSDFYIFHRS